jgi:hypothetical protein
MPGLGAGIKDSLVKLDNVLMNRFLKAIVPSFIVFLFWLFFKDRLSSVDSTINKMQCATEKEVMQESLNGVVVTSYRDAKNRDVRTLNYLSDADTLVSKIFYYETGDVFNYLKSGDSVRKESGSLEFTITRNGADTTYVLKYACK